MDSFAFSIFLFSIFFDTVITGLNVSEVHSSLLLSSILGHKHLRGDGHLGYISGDRNHSFEQKHLIESVISERWLMT